MEKKRITLKDVAIAAGSNLATVHCALNHKPGVSKEARERILRVAEEMGYRTNHIASALKRKSIHFLVVLPEATCGGRFYYSKLWQGQRDFFQSMSDFHVTVDECSYSRIDGESLANSLQQALERCAVPVDGVITMGMDHPKMEAVMNYLAQQHIPIILVGTDAFKDKRFCCVRSDNYQAGSMAAELLILCGVYDGKILVDAGDPTSEDHDYNIKGFEAYFRQEQVPVEVLKLYHFHDQDKMYKHTAQALRDEPHVTALYSCTARNSLPMCQALQEAGLAGTVKMVGNDVFAESREYLQQGVMQALIHKSPYQQSYVAASILFDFVIKNEYPPSADILIPPTVALRGNVEQCMHDDQYHIAPVEPTE